MRQETGEIVVDIVSHRRWFTRQVLVFGNSTGFLWGWGEGKNWSFTRNWRQWTHWICYLSATISLFDRICQTQHIVSAPTVAENRRPIMLGSVWTSLVLSQIEKLSNICFKTKDQNCCLQSQFLSSGCTKFRLQLMLHHGPHWGSLQRSHRTLS